MLANLELTILHPRLGCGSVNVHLYKDATLPGWKRKIL